MILNYNLILSSSASEILYVDQNGAVSSSRQQAIELTGGGVSTRRANLNWCRPLHFIPEAESRPVIALASFPGSGNTWLRYLLQQATGVYTGSVYKDYGLLKNGFPAESVVNGSVSVVKTHEWGPTSRKRFHRAVLLIRAPGPAILAEFNRQSGGHVGFASPERYRRNKGRYWQQFVKDKLRTWRLSNLDWLWNFTGPTHVIVYEELVSHLERTLRALIEFLELPLDEAELQCAIVRREGIYKRKSRAVTLDPFTPYMKASLKAEQDFVFKEIQMYLDSA
ncbi:WSCD family member GA21586 isoform X2 [Homalodisca vitripennis]|uniref:WSCD family member GA21586 isoform X2 n=1 Tax=Homalodisca vitripennis TaxID=197043 RepID=UPI001EEAD2FD|nr:WSCD family member GA21586 isoform X2 [Homalodisca vitripennis]